MSHDYSVDWASTQMLRHINPHIVYDVGCGEGLWGKTLRKIFPHVIVHGIEVFDQYIKAFSSKHNIYYKSITQADIRDFDWDKISGDLIIFGDVLEHMTRDEAVAVVTKASTRFRYCLIQTPYGFYPQDHIHGNKYEEHISSLSEKDFEQFPFEELYIRFHPEWKMMCLLLDFQRLGDFTNQPKGL